MSNYALIKGSFHVVGFSPDGDSLKFKADDRTLWDRFKDDTYFKTFKTNLNNEDDDGAVQLRLQSIDALETHYPCMGKSFSQPTDIGRKAAEALMTFLKIMDFGWNEKHPAIVSYVKLNRSEKKVTTKGQDLIPGYIITSKLDDKGRPLVWVFAGTGKEFKDGELWDENKLSKYVAKSANYSLLKQGLVYPLFYNSLPQGILKQLAQAAEYACGNHLHLWSQKQPEDGWKKLTINMITQETLIIPYLFRKIIKNKYKTVDSLVAIFELKDIPEKEKFIRNEVIIIENGTLRMRKKPWEILFQDSW